MSHSPAAAGAAISANAASGANAGVESIEPGLPPPGQLALTLSLPHAPARRGFPRLRGEWHRQVVAWCFLLPNVSGFLVFTFLPVVASAALSLFAWDLYSAPRFVGLRNFRDLLGFHAAVSGASGWLLAGFFLAAAGAAVTGGASVASLFTRRWVQAIRRLGAFLVFGSALVALSRVTWRVWEPNDPGFWKYFYNTLFMMGAIPIDIFASLLLALVMNQKLRGVYFFRLVYFLPSIVAGVGTYILWRWLYQPQDGAINTLLAAVGLPRSPWLNSPAWAKPALMLMGFWGAVGGTNMILYLAALQNVPPELLEAAQIDGANGFQRFWAVTWPTVMPTTFFIFVMSVIGGFQSGFDAAFVMTGGGPSGSTTTLSYYIYNEGFVNNHMGYAAAIAWFLFFIVFGVTMLNYRFGGTPD